MKNFLVFLSDCLNDQAILLEYNTLKDKLTIINMSEAGGHTPGDRSGRGKALLEALKAKKEAKKVGEEGAAAHPPTGRAAVLAAIKRNIEAKTMPSQSRGRAALMSKLKAKGAPGHPKEDKLPPGSGVFPTGTRPSPPSSESPKSSDSPKTPPSLQTPSSVSDAASGLAKMRVAHELKSPVIKRGEGGKTVPLTANYIWLDLEKGRGVFEYEVMFEPRVDAKNIRFKCLNQHRDIIGPTKLFDGAMLILPFQLPDSKTILQSENPNDGSPVTVTASCSASTSLTASSAPRLSAIT